MVFTELQVVFLDEIGGKIDFLALLNRQPGAHFHLQDIRKVFGLEGRIFCLVLILITLVSFHFVSGLFFLQLIILLHSMNLDNAWDDILFIKIAFTIIHNEHNHEIHSIVHDHNHIALDHTVEE